QQDANWNVTALVNGSGSTLERDVNDPYGNGTFLTATWGSLSGSAYAWIYLFQGGRFDSASGVYDSRMRQNSPTLGRWINVDPLLFVALDLNLYRLDANDPTIALDPFGLITANLIQPPFIPLDMNIPKGCPDCPCTAKNNDCEIRVKFYPKGVTFRITNLN